MVDVAVGAWGIKGAGAGAVCVALGCWESQFESGRFATSAPVNAEPYWPFGRQSCWKVMGSWEHGHYEN